VTRFFEVNVLSGVRLSRKYLPGMLKKNWGRVIFISSESAQNIPTEHDPRTGMTKTAQVAIARGWRSPVTGTGGHRKFPFWSDRPLRKEPAFSSITWPNSKYLEGGDDEKMFFEKARPGSLLKRFETSEEVAAVVAFVASTQALVIMAPRFVLRRRD